MAQMCDICDTAEAAFIVSLVETGDTNYQCPGCYARLGLEAAKRILAPEEIAATIGPLFVEGGQQPGRGGNARRERKSKAPKPEQSEPESEAAEGLEGPQAATSDS